MAQEAADFNDKLGFYEMMDKVDCKTGTADVLAKHEMLYQEFVDCVKNTVDIKMMNQDLRFMLKSIITSMKFTTSMSETVMSSIRVYSQRFVKFVFIHFPWSKHQAGKYEGN